MHRSRFGWPALLGAAILLLAIPLAAACGGDDGEAHADDTSVTSVVSAVTYLDGLGLHGIDDSINKDQKIPADARAKALKAQAVAKTAPWPAELKPKADALAAIFGEMAAALEGDSPDLAKAGAAAKKAHDAEHEFADAAWAWIFEQAGIEGPGHGH